MIAVLFSTGELVGGAYVLVRFQHLPLRGATRPFLCVFQENVSSIETKHAAKCNVLPCLVHFMRVFDLHSFILLSARGCVETGVIVETPEGMGCFPVVLPWIKKKELRDTRVEVRWVKFVRSGDADQPTVSRCHVASALVFSKKISEVKLDDRVQRVLRR